MAALLPCKAQTCNHQEQCDVYCFPQGHFNTLAVKAGPKLVTFRSHGWLLFLCTTAATKLKKKTQQMRKWPINGKKNTLCCKWNNSCLYNTGLLRTSWRYRSIEELLVLHVQQQGWRNLRVFLHVSYLVLLASALLVIVQHVLSDVLPLPVVCRHVVHALLEALVFPPAGVEKQPQHQHWGVPERR